MSKVFNFQEDQEQVQEEHTCETCELIEDAFDYIFNIAENRNEVISYLVDAFYNAQEIGYKNAMKEIVSYGVHSIQELECCCCEEDCDC